MSSHACDLLIIIDRRRLVSHFGPTVQKVDSLKGLRHVGRRMHTLVDEQIVAHWQQQHSRIVLLDLDFEMRHTTTTTTTTTTRRADTGAQRLGA